MKHFIISIILPIAFIVPLSVLSHEEGVYFEKTVGDYVIDIGYSDAPIGEPRTFDFALYKGVEKEKVAFDDVWVRISKDSKTVFAGPIDYGAFGQPVLTITLDTPGVYLVEANYEIAAKSLAISSFPVQAFSRETGFFTSGRVIALCISIFSILAGFFVGRIAKKYAKTN